MKYVLSEAWAAVVLVLLTAFTVSAIAGGVQAAHERRYLIETYDN